MKQVRGKVCGTASVAPRRMGCISPKGANPEAQRLWDAAEEAQEQPAKPPETETLSGDFKDVMGKYRMGTKKEDITGEGTSSICRKGTEIATGQEVAIKVYKEKAVKKKKDEEVKMQKFKRQIEVLQWLQEPFKPPSDKALWNQHLEKAKPKKLFMILIDYSKDENGNPGPYSKDGVLYVVTELASYSLKDFFILRKEQNDPIPPMGVQSICHGIIKVVAGLHAKGMAHLDLKPENLMMFNGELKLIDVDGCVPLGSSVHITDSTISFSPCYCAPEWAAFLISEDSQSIEIAHSLDAWSVGITVCELVSLGAILKAMYRQFLRHAVAHDEAGFLFLEWLSTLKKSAPLPKNVKEFDADFVDLVSNWLLVFDSKKRKSCAECLAHPYFASLPDEDNSTRESNRTSSSLPVDFVARAQRVRAEDDSKTTPLHKGILFKLDTGGDPKDETLWRQRDMWVSKAGSICYFSIKENKRLVIVDGSKLHGGSVEKFEGGCKPYSFEVKYKSDDEDQILSVFFACESQKDYKLWIKSIKGSTRLDIPTMHLGRGVKEMRAFIVKVKNRRQKVDEADQDGFEPVFKDNLWKLKAEGDPIKQADWFEREMWLSKNGSLVYHSHKEERHLVYYTAADLMRARCTITPPGTSVKPFAFKVHLPVQDNMEFAPGEFAASSEDARQKWITEFANISQAGDGPLSPRPEIEPQPSNLTENSEAQNFNKASSTVTSSPPVSSKRSSVKSSVKKVKSKGKAKAKTTRSA